MELPEQIVPLLPLAGGFRLRSEVLQHLFLDLPVFGAAGGDGRFPGRLQPLHDRNPVVAGDAHEKFDGLFPVAAFRQQTRSPQNQQGAVLRFGKELHAAQDGFRRRGRRDLRLQVDQRAQRVPPFHVARRQLEPVVEQRFGEFYVAVFLRKFCPFHRQLVQQGIRSLRIPLRQRLPAGAERLEFPAFQRREKREPLIAFRLGSAVFPGGEQLFRLLLPAGFEQGVNPRKVGAPRPAAQIGVLRLDLGKIVRRLGGTVLTQFGECPGEFRGAEQFRVGTAFGQVGEEFFRPRVIVFGYHDLAGQQPGGTGREPAPEFRQHRLRVVDVAVAELRFRQLECTGAPQRRMAGGERQCAGIEVDRIAEVAGGEGVVPHPQLRFRICGRENNGGGQQNRCADGLKDLHAVNAPAAGNYSAEGSAGVADSSGISSGAAASPPLIAAMIRSEIFRQSSGSEAISALV